MAGDVAEAMLDGTLCESCGEFLGKPAGYPVKCAGCKKDEIEAPLNHKHTATVRLQAVFA